MEATGLNESLAHFAADVQEGDSRSMGRDEVAPSHPYRVSCVIDRLIASHRGRIFNTAGDSVLARGSPAVLKIRPR